jgi:hypothetical protein
VFANLTEELQIQRAGVHGAKVAENLFTFEERRDLVGVGHEAQRAVYYETASRSIVAVRSDKHGVCAGKRELPQRELDGPTAWVEAYGSGPVRTLRTRPTPLGLAVVARVPNVGCRPVRSL